MSVLTGPPAGPQDASDSFTFTVGKLDAGMAILIGPRASLIEFPSLLLPPGVGGGSVVNIRVTRNESEEERTRKAFVDLQEKILNAYGSTKPQTPVLRERNVTQTSVALEWDKVELASARILGLDIYRNGARLAAIPNPLVNTSTKLSGLDVDAEYSFHLVLRTSAGALQSNIVRTRTHTIQDTSGVAVCLGHIEDPNIERAAVAALRKMNAHTPTDKIQIETTHYVCSDPRNRGDPVKGGMGSMYNRAAQLSLPIVQPAWIFACYAEKKMVPISAYYLGQEPPNLPQLRKTIGGLLHEQDELEKGPDDDASGDDAHDAGPGRDPAHGPHEAPGALTSPGHDGRDHNISTETVVPREQQTLAQPSEGLASSPLELEHAPVLSAAAEGGDGGGLSAQPQSYASATTQLTESMEEVNLASSPGLHARDDSQDLPTEEIDLS